MINEGDDDVISRMLKILGEREVEIYYCVVNGCIMKTQCSIIDSAVQLRSGILSLTCINSCGLRVLLLLYAVTHAPFHAPVLRPTSWPNARDRRDREVN